MTTLRVLFLSGRAGDRIAIRLCCDFERHDGYGSVSDFPLRSKGKRKSQKAYKVENVKQTVTPAKKMPSIRISFMVAVVYCRLNSGYESNGIKE